MKSLFLLLCAFFISKTVFCQDTFLSDFQLKWKNASEYTLEFAQSMPEDRYDFKPMEDEMSFREQLKHIAGNMVWLSSSYLKGSENHVDPQKSGDSKKEILLMLDKAFDYAQKTIASLTEAELNEQVDFFAGQMTRRRILLLLTDHVTHHRGQLVVYLRLNDIKPPRYRGW